MDATETQSTGITPEFMAKTEEAVCVAMSPVRDREVMRRACEEMDRISAEIYQKHGLLDIGVPAIREFRVRLRDTFSTLAGRSKRSARNSMLPLSHGTVWGKVRVAKKTTGENALEVLMDFWQLASQYDLEPTKPAERMERMVRAAKL